MRRALQDITNVCNSRIKLTIKKEEPIIRREILYPFLEYASTFYKHTNVPISRGKDALNGYKGEVSLEMRKILVLWMYQVKEDLKLTSSTFQIGVRILDTYAAKNSFEKRTLQLIGCVSLYIASKSAESKSFFVDSFLSLCAGAYIKSEFILMEKKILLETKFTVFYLLPMQVIQRDHKTLGNAICEYMSESILLDVRYVKIPPVKIAEWIEENMLLAVSGKEANKDFLRCLTISSYLLSVKPLVLREFVRKITATQTEDCKKTRYESSNSVSAPPIL